MGLNALQATSNALDLYEQVIEPHTNKQEGVQPPPPDTPQMLPSVHAIWSPLMGALKVALCICYLAASTTKHVAADPQHRLTSVFVNHIGSVPNALLLACKHSCNGSTRTGTPKLTEAILHDMHAAAI